MKISVYIFIIGLIFTFFQNVEGKNRASHAVIIRIVRRNEISIQRENSGIDRDPSHCHLKLMTDHCDKKITVSCDQRLSRQLGIRLENHDNGCMINNIPSISENQEIVTLQSGSEGQIDLNYIINSQEFSTIKNNYASVLFTITDK